VVLGRSSRTGSVIHLNSNVPTEAEGKRGVKTIFFKNEKPPHPVPRITVLPLGYFTPILLCLRFLGVSTSPFVVTEAVVVVLVVVELVEVVVAKVAIGLLKGTFVNVGTFVMNALLIDKGSDANIL